MANYRQMQATDPDDFNRTNSEAMIDWELSHAIQLQKDRRVATDPENVIDWEISLAMQTQHDQRTLMESRRPKRSMATNLIDEEIALMMQLDANSPLPRYLRMIPEFEDEIDAKAADGNNPSQNHCLPESQVDATESREYQQLNSVASERPGPALTSSTPELLSPVALFVPSYPSHTPAVRPHRPRSADEESEAARGPDFSPARRQGYPRPRNPVPDIISHLSSSYESESIIPRVIQSDIQTPLVSTFTQAVGQTPSRFTAPSTKKRVVPTTKKSAAPSSKSSVASQILPSQVTEITCSSCEKSSPAAYFPTITGTDGTPLRSVTRCKHVYCFLCLQERIRDVLVPHQHDFQVEHPNDIPIQSPHVPRAKDPDALVFPLRCCGKELDHRAVYSVVVDENIGLSEALVRKCIVCAGPCRRILSPREEKAVSKQKAAGENQAVRNEQRARRKPPVEKFKPHFLACSQCVIQTCIACGRRWKPGHKCKDRDTNLVL
ncbi:hypothetical protein C8J56DRAFT_1049709 [Mycena floridula]|nr:hypothetical protein C8J56DRAFT_1049709 [Mycena floridula]